MMTKQKTSFLSSAVYMLIAPVLCLLLFAFSNAPITGYDENYFLEETERVIIIDAGHGGKDAGAVNKEGVAEKDLVLSVAKGIQRAAAQQNIKVVLTRNADEAVELGERVLIASRQQADLFISLHANFHQENSSLSGLECFVSESNVRFKDSKRFAEVLNKELYALKGIGVNDIQEANFYVLSKNTVPAIILQVGYLSNKSDYEYVADEANQQRISERIISAIAKFGK